MALSEIIDCVVISGLNIILAFVLFFLAFLAAVVQFVGNFVVDVVVPKINAAVVAVKLTVVGAVKSIFAVENVVAVASGAVAVVSASFKAVASGSLVVLRSLGAFLVTGLTAIAFVLSKACFFIKKVLSGASDCVCFVTSAVARKTIELLKKGAIAVAPAVRSVVAFGSSCPLVVWDALLAVFGFPVLMVKFFLFAPKPHFKAAWAAMLSDLASCFKMDTSMPFAEYFQSVALLGDKPFHQQQSEQFNGDHHLVFQFPPMRI